jgi:hypothetical protein
MRWLVVLALVGGCARDIEGDTVGECEDGADNDRDGTYDCADMDCFGAPACSGDPTDTVDPTDTPQDTTDPADTDPLDTPSPTTQCVTSWDGTGDRPSGPHEAEVGLVSAWLIDPASYNISFGQLCNETQNPDWDGVFDPANIVVPDVPGTFNYVFYRTDNECFEATKQRCAQYPDNCRDDERVFAIDQHKLTADAEAVDASVDNLLAPGCVLTVTQTPIILDNGVTGKLVYERLFDASVQCPADVKINDGCVITFTYDLSWVRAE